MERVSINSNIAALRAFRQVNESSKSLEKSFLRLSSGQRINRASDDAAGLSIANALNADHRVFSQGVKNINDGISFLNIANGAVENLTGVLIRMRELSTQSANGIYSSEQRTALDSEFQGLTDEYNRVRESTEFNGQNVLTASKLILQGGYGEGGTLIADLGDSPIVEGSEPAALGNGTFGTETLHTVSLPSIFAADVGDVNGDGNADLILGSGFSYTTGVMLGNGDGSFQAINTFSSNGTGNIILNDFNEDGRLDILTTSYSNININFGNGDGTFGAIQSVTNGGMADIRRATIGDVNNDGNIDIGVTYGGSLGVILGNGDGTFAAQHTHSQGGTLTAMQFVDMDNDGNMDIMAGNQGFATLEYFKGNGDGTFQGRVSLFVNGGSGHLLAGDYNQDGNMDVAVSSYPQGKLNVYMGNGNGTLQAPTSYDTGGGSNLVADSVDQADYNGDGYEDIIVASVGGVDRLSVLLSNGDGTFQERISFSHSSLGMVEASDVNGDGVADLIGGKYTTGTNSLTIRLTNTQGDEESGSTENATYGMLAPLNGMNVLTRDNALSAQTSIDSSMEALGTTKSIIGASMSRFQITSEILRVGAENFKAAEGQIMDSDVAKESANMIRTQILRNAGSSVLAQANQLPQIALALIS